MGEQEESDVRVAARSTRWRVKRAVVAAASVGVLGVGIGYVSLQGRPHAAGPAGSRSMTSPMPTMTRLDGMPFEPDGMPTRSVPPAPDDFVKDGLRYRARVGGDTLAVGFIGDRGQSEAVLSWDTTTTRVTLGGDCYVRGVNQATADRINLQLSLVGDKPFGSVVCVAGAPEPELRIGSWSPGEPESGWQELSLGRTAKLRVQLVDAQTGAPVTNSSARITAAVYNQGPQQAVRDPKTGVTLAALPEVIEQAGYTYRLTDLRSGSPSVKLPPLATPAGAPFLVTFGSSGMPVGSGLGPDGANPGLLRLIGVGEDISVQGDGGRTTVPQPARSQGTIQLVREGPVPKSGVDFVALYQLDS